MKCELSSGLMGNGYVGCALKLLITVNRDGSEEVIASKRCCVSKWWMNGDWVLIIAFTTF